MPSGRTKLRIGREFVPNGSFAAIVITKSHVDALLELTARHNRDGLTTCLLDSIRKIAASAAIAVYKLYSLDNQQEFNAANLSTALIQDARDLVWKGEPLSAHAGFGESVASGKVIKLQGAAPNTTRMIFPVRGQRHIVGLLVVDYDKNDAGTLYMIEAVAQVWNSQMYLLDKNERDPLTGLLNRQAFESHIPTIFNNLQSAQSAHTKPLPMCLAIMDIDYFKAVNDTYGHLFGDELLVRFAQLMTRSFRYCDNLYRYGGEEFIVVLYNVDKETGRRILERLRDAVEQYAFPQVGRKTISIGAVQLSGSELPSTFLDQADKALYYAKQNGRNRICIYEDLVQQGLLVEHKVADGDIELF